MVETMLCGPQISLHFPFPEYRETYTSQFCFAFTKQVGLEEVMGVGNGYKAFFIIFLSFYLVSLPHGHLLWQLPVMLKMAALQDRKNLDP